MSAPVNDHTELGGGFVVEPGTPGLIGNMQRHGLNISVGTSGTEVEILCEPSQIAVSGGYMNLPPDWAMTTSINNQHPSSFIPSSGWLFAIEGPAASHERTVWLHVLCVQRGAE